MKQFNLFTFGLLLLSGCLLTSAIFPEESEGEDGDYTKCDEGSDLFDPPECPDTDPEDPVYFPFPYNCLQYYECTNNIARCIHCGPGTVWDQELKTCNHPSAVNCTIVTTAVPTTAAPTTTTTTTTPTTTTPTTTTPTTTTPTTTTTTTATTTTTTTEPPTTVEDDPINWICPEGFIGLMRHPYDCSLFYNCDPGRRPCLFDCPSGLYYNPANRACDFPYNVPDCKDGSPPPTSTTPAIPQDSAGNSLNYRNARRANFADAVQFVANSFRGDERYRLSDPCQVMRGALFA